MIASELSYYQSSFDTDDERLLYEHELTEIARRRDAAVNDLGRVATLALSGGTIEAATYHHPTESTPEKVVTSSFSRSLGGAAITGAQLNPEMLMRRYDIANALSRHEVALAA